MKEKHVCDDSCEDNFYDLFTAVTPEAITEVAREKLFKKLWSQYGRPNRHYHGTGHLCYLYRILSPCIDTTPGAENFKQRSIWLAVLYHDVVYEGRAGTDEELSCNFFDEDADILHLPRKLRDAVKDLIKYTAHHFDRPADLTSAAHLFLDADLASLGDDLPTFIANEEAIRMECAHVPSAVWTHKRREFVNRALSATRIYHTRYVGREREWQARANLTDALGRTSA